MLAFMALLFLPSAGSIYPPNMSTFSTPICNSGRKTSVKETCRLTLSDGINEDDDIVHQPVLSYRIPSDFSLSDSQPR